MKYPGKPNCPYDNRTKVSGFVTGVTDHHTNTTLEFTVISKYAVRYQGNGNVCTKDA